MRKSRSPSQYIEPRPLLRLYQPDEPTEGSSASPPQPTWTVRQVFERLRWPDLQAKKTASDGWRWLRYWEQFQAELEPVSNAPPEVREQRSVYPLAISAIDTPLLRRYADWLASDDRFPLPGGASSINKAVKEIFRLLDLAAEEGIPVQRCKMPTLPRVRARPRYYFTPDLIGRLWRAAERIDWPPAKAKPRTGGGTFRGTGMPTASWWRCVLVLLRTYGMRVQDLLSYAKGKSPLLWAGVSHDPQSPNPESLERWPLGWLYYRAAKTSESSGREYYLPLTPAARVAVDRLRTASVNLDGRADPTAPVFRLPQSHGLTQKFQALQRLAEVATRSGQPYQLEDFRKTLATYSSAVHAELPWALCGWSGGGGSSDVARKHYQQPEHLLVRYIMQMPMPECFAEWERPEDVEAVRQFLASQVVQ